FSLLRVCRRKNSAGPMAQLAMQQTMDEIRRPTGGIPAMGRQPRRQGYAWLRARRCCPRSRRMAVAGAPNPGGDPWGSEPGPESGCDVVRVVAPARLHEGIGVKEVHHAAPSRRVYSSKVLMDRMDMSAIAS